MRAAWSWTALAALLAVSGVAEAAPARRTIPWYMSHQSERAATIAACRDDATYARSPDCANAEMAETRLWAGRARNGAPAASRRQSLIEALNSPDLYSNRMFRTATLANCRAGNPMMTARECGVAARAGR